MAQIQMEGTSFYNESQESSTPLSQYREFDVLVTATAY